MKAEIKLKAPHEYSCARRALFFILQISFFILILMILGLGTDICGIERVARYLERYGERFTRRCFTPDEIAYCERYSNRAEQYAARIAAKEAASKALGTGWRRGVHWKCFEVASQHSGKPFLRIHGRAAEIASEMGVRHTQVSLTHDAGVALAVVIFEGA